VHFGKIGRSRSCGKKSPTPARGCETILVVEDEPAVRRASAEFLALQGYNVLEAKDGVDALATTKRHSAPIHLVLTDVVTPNMSGGELAEQIRRVRPGNEIAFRFRIRGPNRSRPQSPRFGKQFSAETLHAERAGGEDSRDPAHRAGSDSVVRRRGCTNPLRQAFCD
jgi:CheY-like chemotaxis protein